MATHGGLFENYAQSKEAQLDTQHEYEAKLDRVKERLEEKFGDFIRSASTGTERKDRIRSLDDEIRAEVGKILPLTYRTVARATSVFNDRVGKKVTSTWTHVPGLGGWVAYANDAEKHHFLCTACGRALKGQGRVACKCGKDWNSSRIDSYGSTASLQALTIWREVEDDRHSVVAFDKSSDILDDGSFAPLPTDGVIEPESLDLTLDTATGQELTDLLDLSPDMSDFEDPTGIPTESSVIPFDLVRAIETSEWVDDGEKVSLRFEEETPRPFTASYSKTDFTWQAQLEGVPVMSGTAPDEQRALLAASTAAVTLLDSLTE